MHNYNGGIIKEPDYTEIRTDAFDKRRKLPWHRKGGFVLVCAGLAWLVPKIIMKIAIAAQSQALAIAGLVITVMACSTVLALVGWSLSAYGDKGVRKPSIVVNGIALFWMLGILFQIAFIFLNEPK